MRRPRQITIDYSFDPRAQRYRDETNGRFIAWREVRAQVDRVIDSGSDRLQALTERLVRGELSVADWMRGMGREIKSQNLLAAVAARGGWEQMTPSDFGRIGAKLRNEYGYLRRFAEQIARGEIPLDGRVVARSRLYAQAARIEYEQIRREAGIYTHERRVLHASESCEDCVEYAARGWRTIGTLPPVGDSRCGVNCRCTFEFSNLSAPLKTP